ncbi:MAG: lysophospholipid acyltransferase family protein [Proteobacteria bacterium]|nr:lysophospholipid acyltransferase family protein [Pseudomonadota bacterium]
MGKLLKRVGRKPAVQRMVGATLAAHIGLVRRTTRWKTVGEAAARGAWAGEKPVIVAFWHNRLAMMPYCWPSARPFHMLISSHPDGQLIARTVKHFGIETVAGSSTRGGSEALRSLVRLIKSGVSVGITPDGPRGPRMRASDGAIALARLSGASIVPAAVSVSRRVVLGSWDRLIVALPFGEGAMVWGDPITVTNGDDPDALRARLEADLTRVSAQADEMVGHAPIMPGELADARA